LLPLRFIQLQAEASEFLQVAVEDIEKPARDLFDDDGQTIAYNFRDKLYRIFPVECQHWQ